MHSDTPYRVCNKHMERLSWILNSTDLDWDRHGIYEAPDSEFTWWVWEDSRKFAVIIGSNFIGIRPGTSRTYVSSATTAPNFYVGQQDQTLSSKEKNWVSIQAMRHMRYPLGPTKSNGNLQTMQKFAIFTFFMIWCLGTRRHDSY
jgi:hypothetical protein